MNMKTNIYMNMSINVDFIVFYCLHSMNTELKQNPKYLQYMYVHRFASVTVISIINSENQN